MLAYTPKNSSLKWYNAIKPQGSATSSDFTFNELGTDYLFIQVLLSRSEFLIAFVHFDASSKEISFPASCFQLRDLTKER